MRRRATFSSSSRSSLARSANERPFASRRRAIHRLRIIGRRLLPLTAIVAPALLWRAVTLWSTVVAERRARAVEITLRRPAAAGLRLKTGTVVRESALAALWRTTIHLIGCRSGSAIRSAAIELLIALLRRHRRAHFIFTATHVATPFPLWAGAVLIHHGLAVPTHFWRPHSHSAPAPLLSILRTTFTSAIVRLRTLAPFRLHGWRRALALKITIRPSLRRRAVLLLRTGIALLLRLPVRALHLSAVAAKAASAIAVLRAGFLVARRRGTISFRAAVSVLARRRILRRSGGSIFLSAERPRGEREHCGGDECRCSFHSMDVWVHRTNAAVPGFCAGRICK